MKKNDLSSAQFPADSKKSTKYRNKITNEKYEGGSGEAGIAYIDGVKFRRVFPLNVGQRPILIRDDALEKYS